MPVEFQCVCGRRLRAPESAAGRKGRCPNCGHIFTVPEPAGLPAWDEPPTATAAADDEGAIPLAAPAASSAYAVAPPPPPISTAFPAFSIGGAAVTPTLAAPPRAAVAAPRAVLPLQPGNTGRRHLYWLLLLVLIPLAWSTLHSMRAGGDDDEHTLKAHLRQTVRAHPEILPKLEALPEDATTDQLFEILPGHRFEGALLPHDTWFHWVFAAISGVVFLALVMLVFPLGHAKPHHLAGIALFTGTAGIVLLLGFQWLAFHMPLFTPRGVISLLLDLVWLIGQSYACALGDHGFLVSFLGFTAGVGFCEEVCKALPMVVKSRSSGFATWRSAMLWGLISGVGFGVSEGITYSADSYNGISGPGIYWVRFVSCVGLHAIWAAAVGITIFRRQDVFRGQLHPLEWVMRLAQVVIVPMVLHGLYDTLLKQKFDLYALLVALASFGWLAFQIESATRQFDNTELGAAIAGTA